MLGGVLGLARVADGSELIPGRQAPVSETAISRFVDGLRQGESIAFTPVAVAAIGLAAVIQFATGVLERIEPGIGAVAVMKPLCFGLDFPDQSGELVQYTGAGLTAASLGAVGRIEPTYLLS